MTTGIDTLSSFTNWQRLYNLLSPDKKSPYFSPEYYQAYMEVERYPVQCFWAFKDDKNFLFYPYMKRSINSLGYKLDDQYYDVCGAYGYNGPMGKIDDNIFLTSYNEMLRKHLVIENVVTEFVRYSPIPENRHFHTYPEQIDVLDNIYVDLTKGIDYLWSNSYKKNLRTSIRKGASYNLKSVMYIDNDINEHIVETIYDIYTRTMQRNQANSFYYCSIEFINKLRLLLSDKLILIVTYYENKAISFELLMLDGINSYAILRGTLSDYYKQNPNTFQMNELFIGLIDCGIKIYSMGGGVSRSDNLYSYKKSFAKNCDNPFFIGTYVHNKTIYEELLKLWCLQNNCSSTDKPGKIQFYRDLIS